jgi:uncharacterized damage-inducible protein DinB
MTTQTRSAVLTNGLGALAFARRLTTGLLEDLPADKLTFQACPGANHALWIAGHLTYADNGFRTQLGKQESVCPESWDALFGMGSKPTADASAYPSMSEVMEKMTEARARLEAWFESMTDEQLAEPLPGDWAQFASCYGELMSNLASHESLHAGQLSMIRRALGMPPRF